MARQTLQLRQFFIVCLIIGAWSLEEATMSQSTHDDDSRPIRYQGIGFDRLYQASDFGYQILGFLISGKDSSSSIVLVKEKATRKTLTLKSGSTFANKKYTITSVLNGLIVVESNSERIGIFRDGFPVAFSQKEQPKKKVKKRVGFFDSYKEDGFERDGGKITMSRKYRIKVLNDLPKILMQASASPVLNSHGEIDGFLIDQIDKGSIFWKSGITDGDVVTQINGHQLTDVTGTISLLRSLKKTDGIEVTIKRKNVPISLTLNVK